jgi:hypothetical protein
MPQQICVGLETPWNSMHIAIMPEKQPKRPNNNAKALESWESEGGAPASDDCSTKRKRPRVLNQITKAQPLTNQNRRGARTKVFVFALTHAAIHAPAPAYNCEDPVVRYCIAGYSYPEVWCLRTRT